MTPTGIPASRRVLWGTCAALALALIGGVAWGFWTAGVAPGSSGSSAAAAVNQVATPSVSLSSRRVTVNWAPATLSNGDPVTGYVVRRFDADTLAPQPIGSGCEGTRTTSTCTESRVPAGQWVYSVTATVGTLWRGPESARSSPVTITGPSLALSTTRVRPGTSVTGSATGFPPGDTLRYHLDGPTGPELSGTLAGDPVPAPIPAGGGGAVSVTVPAGTSDGDHTVHAVASPSSDAASAAIVVDGTPPPAPVLTQTPASRSGDTVSFGFTEAEASARVECRLDTAEFAPCQSPIEYSGLSEGTHTFQARAVDTVGNVSASASHTWTVDLAVPTVAIAFPRPGGAYNDAAFTAGCGTTTTGDVCGRADDDNLVTRVDVSMRRHSTGLFWNGSGFTATETWLLANGTTDWSYLFGAASLPEGGYTLRARASDGTSLGFDASTFTIDRTAPVAPTLTRVPPSPSGSSATLEFTSDDATASFECRLDGDAWTPCSSPQRYTGLTNGSHTVWVRAVDAAGNTSAVSSTTWTVDGTAPTASMTYPTATTVNLAAWSAGCGTPTTGDICGTAGDDGSGLASVAISIRRASTNSYWDGTAFAAPTETWLGADGTTDWSRPFAASSFPADGSYTVRWRAVDNAGNATTGGVDVTIDTAAPATPRIVQAPPEPGGPSAQFDFTVAEAGARTECRLDDAAWTTCSAPVSYSGLADGAHTFAVRAIDSAGNTSAPATHAWTVDSGLPGVAIGFPGGGRSMNDAGYAAGCATPASDLCGTASDPEGNLADVSVSIRRQGTGRYWDGSGFTSTAEVFLPATGAESWSYAFAASAFPADGQYTVRARATDRVGSTATDSVSFSIDRTAPSAPSILSGPTGTTRGDDTFTFTGDSGVTFQCRLDEGAWQICSSPRNLTGLGDGSHSFDVRAVDEAGNTSPATRRTWMVDATGPTGATTFPEAGGAYNNTAYDTGCAAGTGDLCGTAGDASNGVARVELSLQRAGTGLYLDGSAFDSATQRWLAANGTTSWSYPLAATTFPGDDTYVLSVRITDGVGNTSISTTSFRIDRTRPSAVGFTTSNAGIASRLDLGDTFTLTYSEQTSPRSVIAGWNGTTPRNVVVRLAGRGNAKDRLTVYDATNTTQLPLGTVNLNRTDYVGSQPRTFGLSGTPSSITRSGNGFTITLGTPNGNVGTAALPANVTWTPTSGATDLAGNGAFSAAHTENDNDRDF